MFLHEIFMLYINVTNVCMYHELYYYTDWPSVDVSVNDTCTTSVKLLLSILNDQSTCQVSSYFLYLMSSGVIELLPDYINGSHYQFNELESNTRHRIQVTFINGVNVHTVSPGYVSTLTALRKFPK